MTETCAEKLSWPLGGCRCAISYPTEGTCTTAAVPCWSRQQLSTAICTLFLMYKAGLHSALLYVRRLIMIIPLVFSFITKKRRGSEGVCNNIMAEHGGGAAAAAGKSSCVGHAPPCSATNWKLKKSMGDRNKKDQTPASTKKNIEGFRTPSFTKKVNQVEQLHHSTRHRRRDRPGRWAEARQGKAHALSVYAACCPACAT